MGRYSITFEVDPNVGTAPWSGRESAKQKMMQSLYDYLTQRCGVSDAVIQEVVDTPQEVSVATIKRKKRDRL